MCCVTFLGLSGGWLVVVRLIRIICIDHLLRLRVEEQHVGAAVLYSSFLTNDECKLHLNQISFTH